MDAIEKLCHRSRNGYELRLASEIGALRRGDGGRTEPIKPDEWVLVAKTPGHGVAYQYEIYSPPPDLFAKFAQLEPTKDRILDFANAYGNVAPAEIISRKPEYGQTVGEVLSDWIQSQQDFTPAFIIWEALAQAEQGNDERLRQIVSWDRRRAELIRIDAPISRRPYEWPGSPQTARAEIAAMTPGDLFRPARVCLAQEIGSRLNGKISFRLVFTPEGGLTRIFLTETLLSNLWLQLAEAATGATKIKPCKNPKCKNLILIDPRGAGKRSNRETCSDACRFAFYESRKEKAFQLWKNDGRTPDEIAALLSDMPDAPTDSFTVLRWIARRLSDTEKLTDKEIAAALRTSESKVRELLARSKRNARRYTKQKGSKK
jgi:hypothetical protein